MRKKALILLIITLTAVVITIVITNISRQKYDKSNLPQFLATLNITVSGEPVIKNITVPAVFSPVYERYNELQKAAGYDLSAYKGEKAVVYTYDVTNYPDKMGGILSDVKVNIILYGGRIIGGDICNTEMNGFMVPLKAVE